MSSNGAPFPGGTRVGSLLVVVAILLLAWLLVRPVIVTLLVAVAVSSMTFGLYRWMTRRLGGRPRLAAGLLVVGLIVGVIGPFATFIVWGISRGVVEITGLVENVDQLRERLLRLSTHAGPLDPWLRRVAEHLGETASAAVPEVARRLSEVAGTVGGALVHYGIRAFLLSISVYYFYLNGAVWRERLIRLIPVEEPVARTLCQRFVDVSRAVIAGSLGTALLHGVLAGLGYVIFGVPAPFVWAVATALASFIPAIGTALVWGPLSIALMITHGWLRGLGLIIFCAVIVGSADNLARPMLMEKRMGIHQLWVFVALFGGLASFGASGLFLGPLIMAMAIAVLDVYEGPIDTPTPP